MFICLFIIYNLVADITVYPEYTVTDRFKTGAICQGNQSDIRVRWLRNNKYIKQNDKYYQLDFLSPTNVILNVFVNDKTVGEYQCVSEKNQVATFRIETPNTLIEFKKCHSTQVNANDEAFLNCYAISNKTHFFTFWKKDGEKFEENEKFRVSPFGLHISNSNLNDTGIYTLVVVEADKYTQTKDVKLTVILNPVIYFQSRIFKVGDDYNISCQVHSNTKFEMYILNATDEKPKQSIISNSCGLYSITQSIINLDKAEPYTHYNYTCVVIGDGAYLSKKASFNFLDLPKRVNLTVYGTDVSWILPRVNTSQIIWYIVQIASNETSFGMNLTLDGRSHHVDIKGRVKIPGTYVITVWAVNEIGSSLPSTISMDIFEYSKVTTKNATTIYSVAGFIGVGAVCIITGIIFVLYRKRKLRHSNRIEPQSVAEIS